MGHIKIKPVVMFVPYYGNVPPYISAFLHTVALQKDFMDVYFISDDSFLKELRRNKIPENVKMVELGWDGLCNLIVERTSLRKPFFPYKLCDYKPAYGHIFEEYTQGFEYWGYMDIDVLVGDVKGFLERINYQQYDRIGQFGHFTIYRNTEEFRLFYTKEYPGQSYFSKLKNACKTTYPCHIDENGTNDVFLKLYGKDRFLQKNFVLNTSFECKGCHTYNGRNLPQLLTWENGHAYSYILKDGKIEEEEGMYIHFIKEKNLKTENELSYSFIITPDELIPFKKENMHEYFNTVGKVDSPEERTLIMEDFRKGIRNNRKKRLMREVKTVGVIGAIKVMIPRLQAIPDLLKHKLF